jgi:spore coat polysaccharide biosynthesis predicted glycosyltransferase SpsG
MAKKNPIFSQKNVRVIISLGGGSAKVDLINEKLIHAFSLISKKNWTIVIMTGLMSMTMDGQFKNFPSDMSLRIEKHSDFMAQEMMNSDIGIFSGGTTMWEALYMKIPFLGISLNPKQKEYLDFLENEGLCVHLGFHESLEIEALKFKIENFILNLEKRKKILETFSKIINQDIKKLSLKNYLMSL